MFIKKLQFRILDSLKMSKMKRKLIKLLRELEKKSGYESKFVRFDENYYCDYDVTEQLDFPNYRLIRDEYNKKYASKNESGFILAVSDNTIKSELKRMESDGLVSMGVQSGKGYAFAKSNRGPDYDEGFSVTTESVILTTKGKSGWSYFWYQVTENSLSTFLSVIAIIISMFALFYRGS